MIRITAMSGKFYGYEIDSIEDDAENIEEFVHTGEPVLIVESLGDAQSFGVDINVIEMVDHEK
ncbi:MAG: hypothetical protein M1469_01080 [Bacteroidetes bacterium]|nr:hypothetical protein [Bacteroidota bacterium]